MAGVSQTSIPSPAFSILGRTRGLWITRYGGRVPPETYGADVGDQIHPTPKARIGYDHHNGDVGEAKSEHSWPDVLRRPDSPVAQISTATTSRTPRAQSAGGA